MATRSIIGKVNGDGTIRFIYCHWDGYPEYNGKLLFEHYNTPESVEALLALGDLSSLDKDLASCEAYGRDRGEMDTEAQTIDKDELINAAEITGAEYAYIFEGGVWFVYDVWEHKRIGTVDEVIAMLEKEAE